MLLPSQMGVMKLGIHASWTPPAPRKFLGASMPLGAYSRIVAAPRISGDNTTLSDCFPTACCNAVIDVEARLGMPVTVTNDDAKAAYKGMAGYDPADPATDVGTVPEAGFDWWKKNPIAKFVLKDATPIDVSSEAAVRHAIEAGPVIFCQALSVENQNQRVLTNVGQPGSWGRHATCQDEFGGAITEGTSWGGPWYLDRSFFAFVLAIYALDLVIVQ